MQRQKVAREARPMRVAAEPHSFSGTFGTLLSDRRATAAATSCGVPVRPTGTNSGDIRSRWADVPRAGGVLLPCRYDYGIMVANATQSLLVVLVDRCEA